MRTTVVGIKEQLKIRLQGLPFIVTIRTLGADLPIRKFANLYYSFN